MELSTWCSPPSKLPPMLQPHVVLFGDSITQQSFAPGGWGARLADHFVRRADGAKTRRRCAHAFAFCSPTLPRAPLPPPLLLLRVCCAVLNRGYSGYNTRWALPLLEKVFPPGGAAPSLVTVFFGANDAALADQGSARQHVPLEDYTTNLRAIVAHIRAAGCDRIVLVTPPPVHEGQRLEWQRTRYSDDATGVAERTDAAAAQYGVAVQALAAELLLPCLDVRAAMLAEGSEAWPPMLSDGLHLSESGSAFLFDKLIKLVNSHFADLCVTSCAGKRRCLRHIAC